jgi:hypothetical protein
LDYPTLQPLSSSAIWSYYEPKLELNVTL